MDEARHRTSKSRDGSLVVMRFWIILGVGLGVSVARRERDVNLTSA